MSIKKGFLFTGLFAVVLIVSACGHAQEDVTSAESNNDSYKVIAKEKDVENVADGSNEKKQVSVLPQMSIIDDFVSQFYNLYNDVQIPKVNSNLIVNNTELSKFVSADLTIDNQAVGFDPVTCSQDIMVNPKAKILESDSNSIRISVIGEGNAVSHPIVDLSFDPEILIKAIRCK